MQWIAQSSILFNNFNILRCFCSSIFDDTDDFNFQDNYRKSDRREFSERRPSNNLEQELQNMKFQADESDMEFEKDFYTEHSTTSNRSQVQLELVELIRLIWNLIFLYTRCIMPKRVTSYLYQCSLLGFGESECSKKIGDFLTANNGKFKNELACAN